MRPILFALLLSGCAGVATVGKVRPVQPADTDDTAARFDTGDTGSPSDTWSPVDTFGDAIDTDAPPADTAPPVTGDTWSPLPVDSPARPPGPPPDADGDGYCADGVDCPAGLVAGDCDDTDADVNPGALDVAGDGVDQDCDGVGGPPVDTWSPVDTADTGSEP